MATAPVKPHPLHNFPLSLKWGQTTTLTAAATNHHHGNNSSDRSMAPESEVESDPELTRLPPPRIGSRSVRLQRFSRSTILPKTEKGMKQKTAFEEAIAEKPLKQVAVLGNSNEGREEVEEEEEEEEEDKQKQEEEEGNSRPWKLRPRKGILSAKNGGEKEAVQVNDQKERENIQQLQPKSMRLRGLVESSGGGEGFEKKEKRKFWIALSREEIEEDVFIMTGSRPARRPRKRPKNVQKVLDCVFPGLWLVGATADSYRIADAPVKR